jgi:heme iron utilization protein
MLESDHAEAEASTLSYALKWCAVPDMLALARQLIAETGRASLATLAPENWPYVSLILVAGDKGGLPLMLLSDLAEHCKNLSRDPRAALLFDGTAGLAEPLSGPRVTLMGTVEPAEEAGALDRYLGVHPEAASWSSMSDFQLYRLKPARAHLVAGFGRIAWIEAAELFMRRDRGLP